MEKYANSCTEILTLYIVNSNYIQILTANK